MSIFVKVTDSINKMRVDAGTKFDAARLELRIKSYSKELQEKYALLGEMLYKKERFGKEMESSVLNDFLNEVDGIHNRIKYLNKHIDDIKHKSIAKEQPIKEEIRHYDKLNKKQGDLTIKRTVDGIKLLRKCHQCGADNLSGVQICSTCGNDIIFSEAP